MPQSLNLVVFVLACLADFAQATPWGTSGSSFGAGNPCYQGSGTSCDSSSSSVSANKGEVFGGAVGVVIIGIGLYYLWCRNCDEDWRLKKRGDRKERRQLKKRKCKWLRCQWRKQHKEQEKQQMDEKQSNLGILHENSSQEALLPNVPAAFFPGNNNTDTSLGSNVPPARPWVQV